MWYCPYYIELDSLCSGICSRTNFINQAVERSSFLQSEKWSVQLFIKSLMVAWITASFFTSTSFFSYFRRKLLLWPVLTVMPEKLGPIQPNVEALFITWTDASWSNISNSDLIPHGATESENLHHGWDLVCSQQRSWTAVKRSWCIQVLS